MKKLDQLKKQADKAANIRGHSLAWTTTMSLSHKLRPIGAVGHCRCGKYAQVLLAPQPNEIDIGGDALALPCPLSLPNTYDLYAPHYVSREMAQKMEKFGFGMDYDTEDDIVEVLYYGKVALTEMKDVESLVRMFGRVQFADDNGRITVEIMDQEEEE